MADETTIHGHTDDHHETSVDDGETLAAGNNTTTRLADRKVSWSKLRRVDSLSLEAGRVSFAPSHHHASSRDNWQRTLHLAFQCIGVIFGDIGTSPLYVYASTFTKINNKNDILGVLSLVIYTIILVPLLKYVCIILWANDNGDGGTFALYSLMCRHMSVSLRPNQEPEDIELSNNRLETPSNELKRAQKIKEKLESSMLIKTVLFLVTMLATSMVIGDGVLTPCVSVLSAVSGVKSLGEDAVMWISIAILVLLFNVQRFGTDKVGYVFAPALCLWFSFICGIGLYNLCRYDITVLHAFNPMYIVDFFRRNGKEGWASLGGIVLCITGTEAMFADLGHFNVRAVQISFSGVVLPAVLIAYCGQAAYLTKYPDHVGNIFYDSIPDPLYWPMFAIAVMAAIIASQALISGAFAIIRQSLSLGCFPRVKVIHTSSKYEGQVYIPEVNWILMILCITVTYSFKTTTQINNAYGIAVVSVMLITTCMVSLIMLVIWKTQIWLVALFFVAFISIEGIYLSAVLYKFTQGGYLPLLFALVLMMVMVVWHYVHKERYSFELNKVSSEYVRDLAKNPEVKTVPGIMLLYSELVEGIPLIFPHYVSNVRSLHSVVVLVSIKYLPVSKLVPEERFLFRQVGPREYRMFRCVVRYGYNDKIEEPMEFEGQLVDHLMEFIRQEHFIAGSPLALENIHEQPLPAEQVDESLENVSARLSSAEIQTVPSTRTNEAVAGWAEDVQFVQHAKEQGGVFYLLGEATVQAKHDSCFFKKLAVNYVYSFLHKNFRQEENAFAVPQNQHLKVGMVYEI
ncbi:potassium transporter 5-like isoform X2 [Ipomoea triloba]|uniref:potassium transporter 5-like isoform X1 n=1 Tax=Ipomoea triloba TaxID=35885 RepID=UPI00125E8F7E|nr:potassium transporter 5-like isoform X1 [Ipomoea triloba]XP_031098464.1 potassium transporter 5-like isoform X1 [Ipomoea triloba]XP_031098465.1 potassium transporter 5-like isoform X1 [Ipomoea triloba]XP_031098466.1 potassium transporter 5-like isoform X2 [Ipomoea triloba]